VCHFVFTSKYNHFSFVRVSSRMSSLTRHRGGSASAAEESGNESDRYLVIEHYADGERRFVEAGTNRRQPQQQQTAAAVSATASRMSDDDDSSSDSEDGDMGYGSEDIVAPRQKKTSAAAAPPKKKATAARSRSDSEVMAPSVRALHRELQSLKRKIQDGKKAPRSSSSRKYVDSDGEIVTRPHGSSSKKRPREKQGRGALSPRSDGEDDDGVEVASNPYLVPSSDLPPHRRFQPAAATAAAP
jgi:hypothetical protein